MNGQEKADSFGYFAGMLRANAQHARVNQGLYERLHGGQKPKIAVAFCSDSRLQTVAFGDGIGQIGEMFIGRDIGNTYQESTAMVDYAVRHLGVPLLLLLGHTGCGAVKAASGDFSRETPAIRSHLDQVTLSGDPHADPQTNVDAQVDLALASYEGSVTAGDLTILGGVFDLTGVYGGDAGLMYVTNFNGDRGVDTIRASLRRFGEFADDDTLVNRVVKRLTPKVAHAPTN